MTFEEYYDNIQGHLQLLSGMDELLAGWFLVTACTILTSFDYFDRNALVQAKKFRKRGNKDGAVWAFLQLEEESLGKTLVIGEGKGTTQVSLILN